MNVNSSDFEHLFLLRRLHLDLPWVGIEIGN